MDSFKQNEQSNLKPELDTFNHLSGILFILILAFSLLIYAVWKMYEISDIGLNRALEEPSSQQFSNASGLKEQKTSVKSDFWIAPDVESVNNLQNADLIKYGKELIAHTAKYLGPNGTVEAISNGMNCQNCHLDGGTRVFGNNYGSVASTYPKLRARSGQFEDIYKRVNDCFERSLNGKALDTFSNEMQAIKAYITFLGSNVAKNETAKGSGLKDLTFLERAADPIAGQKHYLAKCEVCHKTNGEGILNPDGKEYLYPPLWGKNSYNDAAGLYRISNFAKYIKYNMPLGATYENPQLSDDEAWDIAAFVNSQPRPHKKTPDDWPDISKKPIDHPFGPYDDGFIEEQHKFGPFKPIVDFRKTKSVK
ncbi:MAG: c-type cytochrome [Saprospiraceae bacterium]|nr:c-type cytochrome [Saprospiraceae bacterium]